MEKHRIVGLSAAVVRRGEDVWTGAYGQADLESGRPMTTATAFRIASISKVFVATALLQLVEKGLCALDSDAGELLGFPFRHPHYPEGKVTLAHLLTHTSGLQDEYVRFAVDSRKENPPLIRLEELMVTGGRYHTEDLWGRTMPGDPHGFEYSNLGAIVLATIVEKLSGERFDVYCRRHLFEPLRMMNSSFRLADFANPNRLAVLYSYSEEKHAYEANLDDFKTGMPESVDYSGYIPGTNGALFSPQGGLRSTAADLAKFMLTHLNGGEAEGTRILKPETIRLMHKPHWSGYRTDGFFRNSGLQLQLTDDLFPGRRLIGHAGDAYGLLSDWFFDPEEGWGIVLLMNGLRQTKGDGVFFEAEEDLFRLLYEEWIHSHL
ncbi:serine hydrolase domain-containing protein [Paenibacillus aurantius]|uniref:Serine hydrolase domain-containing protein n=2 Tax=Paenibacillus aurantius TaxID=2918900 RepID=A0AA96RI03_9BACL|nr:serine hydrolase domain-containing protein [Paenibacillus aurantius]WNQ13933.1 serine hydrolase domain-containing protein [Paenibacillus aurantius]